jgi:hypothetical protein
VAAAAVAPVTRAVIEAIVAVTIIAVTFVVFEGVK